MNEHQTTYSSVTRLTMNFLLVQGLLALRPTLADSLPLSPVQKITLQFAPLKLIFHDSFLSGFQPFYHQTLLIASIFFFVRADVIGPVLFGVKPKT